MSDLKRFLEAQDDDFAVALENMNPVFQRVLDKYFDGAKDQKTLELIDV